MNNKEPRVLLWDCETSHNLILAFDLMNKYSPIPYQNILTERHMFCISYKWLGEKKMHTISILDDKKRFKNDIHDDFYVVSEFRKILEQADAQIFHYGLKFDLPMLNARLVKNGLSPVPKMPSIDTKNVASSHFRFNSNRLDYLGKFLGYKGKMDNPPTLWIECWKGDIDALEHMAKYNRQDIDVLEYVYNTLSPFIPNHPLNRNQFTKEVVCHNCGSSNIQWRGFYRTRVNKYRRFSCNSCGSWSVERKSIKDDIKPQVQ